MVAAMGRRVSRYRGARGMSAQALSDRCSQIGYRIDRSVIAKLETGRRQGVTVAEVLVLAEALQVPFPLLMLPLGDADEVEILPGQVRPVTEALAWLSGDPSGGEGEWRSTTTVINQYRRHADLVQAWQTADDIVGEFFSGAARSRPGDDAGEKAAKREADAQRWKNDQLQTWKQLLQLRRTMAGLGLTLPALPPVLAALERAEP